MKFPRNARILRGQLDAAPFASVFFLLLIFVLLGTLMYTPGVRVPLQLPAAEDLPGTDRPTIALAVTADGLYYLENQLLNESSLTNRLRAAAQKSPTPLTLVLYADKAMPLETLIHLKMLARRSGIEELLLATSPRAFEAAAPQ